MTESIVVGGHRRIRPFNTADSYPEQHLSNDLCQAVVAGNTVYLRGQVAQDLDTRESVALGDPAGQASNVTGNIERLLDEAGPAGVAGRSDRCRRAAMTFSLVGRCVRAGTTVLDRLQAGRPAAVALAEVMATAAHADCRQVAVIDQAGRTDWTRRPQRATASLGYE